MNNILRSFFIICLFSFVSCSSVVYGPDTNRMNNPKQKGDLNMSSGITLTPRIFNYSTDFSYSPKQNIGTQAFFNFGDKFLTLGVGAGLYSAKNRYEEKKLIKSVVFDIYPAYSYNRSKGIVNDFTSGEFRYDYRFHDYSIQGGLNFFYKNVGIQLAYRPHVFDIISADVFGDTNITTQNSINNLNNDPFILHDILGKLYFGKKGIHLFLGGSLSISQSAIRELVDPISITTGFNFNLSELFK